jgi:hypothetical protein
MEVLADPQCEALDDLLVALALALREGLPGGEGIVEPLAELVLVVHVDAGLTELDQRCGDAGLFRLSERRLDRAQGRLGIRDEGPAVRGLRGRRRRVVLRPVSIPLEPRHDRQRSDEADNRPLR